MMTSGGYTQGVSIDMPCNLVGGQGP